MKRLLGVVLVLFVACIPMNIHAEEVDLSFEYTGQKVEIENAVMYFTQSWEMLDEAPTDCGTYNVWTSDGETIVFEINPKKVDVKVSYNKDWRESDPEEEKYLCDYVGDYAFKLRIDTDGNINSLDNYQGNYDFQFEPKNVKDIEVLKTKITHPDVEYVYFEDGISIYSDIDHVKPILLKDVGEYTVAFDLDERYYESVPFKVTILPKRVQLRLNKQFKYFGEEDPVLENDDYILTREPGEDIGDYKLTVQSKSKNYKYEIIENDVFKILEKDAIDRNETKGPSFKMDKEVEKTTHKETPVLNKSQSKITTGIQTKKFPYSIALMFSLLGIFVFIFKFI
ncbi:hypothetical protein ACTM8V_06775 [Holdemanella porci]|uniref:hypothetical protein n=1 Tax=Holdemanella porci TaxID=2652276 RepID=UPI003F8989F4